MTQPITKIQNNNDVQYLPAQRNKFSFSMPSQQEMQNLIEFCKVMASAPFYQKLGPGGVMAIYLTAKEHDLPFMACLNGGLHTFDGKVTFAAIMIDALIIKAGHEAQLLYLDETKCMIRFVRGDRKNNPDYKPLEYEYTIEQASKAGYLKKNNWQTSPKDMLYSRCLTGGGRKHIPEVFVGILVAGELVGTDADSNCDAILPASVSTYSCESISPSPTNVSKEPPAPIQISQEIYEDFLKRHEIAFDQESIIRSDKMQYINVVAERCGKTSDDIIKAAIRNETDFVNQFDKWMEKQTRPTRKSIDPES